MPLPPQQRQTGFQVPKQNRYLIRVVFGAVLMTLLVLAILPFTQALSGDPRDRGYLVSVDAILPPPEPPPPEPPPPPEEEKKEDVQDLDTTPPPLSLSQLEASLNPGIGGAAFQAIDFDAFGVAPDITGDIRIFELSDLDSRPRRLSGNPPEYPLQLRIDGVEGVVRLLIMIDENGNVTIMEVVEASHPGFVQPARQAVTTWRFEPPTVGGERVRAKYVQPIPFRLN
jgi:TonB family protein